MNATHNAYHYTAFVEPSQVESPTDKTPGEQNASLEYARREAMLWPLLMQRLGYHTRWLKPSGERLSLEELTACALRFITEDDPMFPAAWAERMAVRCARVAQTRKAYIWRFTPDERERGQEASLSKRQTKADQRRDQVAILDKAGMTGQQIADHLGVVRSTVCEDLKRIRETKNQIGHPKKSQTDSSIDPTVSQPLDGPPDPDTDPQTDPPIDQIRKADSESDLLQDYTPQPPIEENPPRADFSSIPPSASSKFSRSTAAPGRRPLEASALGLTSVDDTPQPPTASEPSDGQPAEALRDGEPPHELEGASAPADKAVGADWTDPEQRAANMLKAGLSLDRVVVRSGLKRSEVHSIRQALGLSPPDTNEKRQQDTSRGQWARRLAAAADAGRSDQL